MIRRLLALRAHIPLLMFLLVLAPFKDDDNLSWQAFGIALSFASLMAGIYLLNKTTDVLEDSINVKSGPIGKHMHRRIRITALIAFTAPVVYLAMVGSVSLVALYALVACLGFFYSVPIRIGSVRYRLKELIGIKTMTPALIWALPPVGANAIIANSLEPENVLTFAVIFCVGAAMETVWDIRDAAGDLASGIRTIPNTLGIGYARVLAVALLLGAVLCGYLRGMNPYSFVAIAVSLAITLRVGAVSSALMYHAIVFVWIVALTAFLLI